MAEGLHVKLGDLIYASNQTPNVLLFPPRPVPLYSAETVARQPNLLPTLEIRPQTIREEATVYAVFAIE
jgi:uncharacterized protein